MQNFIKAKARHAVGNIHSYFLVGSFFCAALLTSGRSQDPEVEVSPDAISVLSSLIKAHSLTPNISYGRTGELQGIDIVMQAG